MYKDTQKQKVFNKESISKILRLIVVLLSFILFLSACSLLPKEEDVLSPPLMEPVQIEYETMEVKRGEIIQRVSGVGNFTPMDTSNFYFVDSGGQIKKIYIQPGDEVKEGDILVELQTGDLEFEIKMIDIELEKARLHLQRAESDKVDSYTVNMAKLDLESIQLRRDHTQAKLERSRLRASSSGIVTFVSENEEGDYVDRYQTLVQVADKKQLHIIYTATTGEKLSNVDLGMQVNVKYGGEDWIGKVVQTPRHLPEDTPPENTNLFRRSILIDLINEPNKDIVMGDLVDIEVITQKQKNTLIIPLGGLRVFMGREYVQVLEENSNIKEIDVETGIITSREIEILAGLEEGDRVIMR